MMWPCCEAFSIAPLQPRLRIPSVSNSVSRCVSIGGKGRRRARPRSLASSTK